MSTRGRGSVGRAPPCQGGGRGFESRRPLKVRGAPWSGRRVRLMSGRRSGHGTWTDRRAEYNRWAGRHTWLIWAIVAALIAILIILIAARLTHPLAPLPDVSSSPQTDQGRLS